jgi:hypothetical protein
MPPETACEILSVLNEINEEFKAELNKNNCKAKDTLAGFAQVFTNITNQALSHIGEFFDFEKDEKIIDRVINHPTKDPLLIKLKKLKIDPFVCEKLAYYQKNIATIRNTVIFNEHGESSDIWRSFSEENLIEKFNNLSLAKVFLKAAQEGDIQYFQTFMTLVDLQSLSPLLLGEALRFASDYGHLKMVQILINSCRFKDIDNFNIIEAFQSAVSCNHLEIVQAFIDSGRFQDISIDSVIYALQYASEYNFFHIVQAIKATDHFRQIQKSFPEEFNKFL